MKLRIRNLLALPVILVPLYATAQEAVPPVAEPTAAPVKEEVKPRKLKPGTLASSGRFGFKSPNIDQVMDDSAPGSEGSPIVASVKRKSSTACVAVITNNDAKSGYAVSIEVTKQSAGGGGAKKTFSASLGPKGTTERQFGCAPDDNFTVALKSGVSIKTK